MNTRHHVTASLDSVILRVTCKKCGNGILIRPAAFVDPMVLCTACTEPWPKIEANAIAQVANALRRTLLITTQSTTIEIECHITEAAAVRS